MAAAITHDELLEDSWDEEALDEEAHRPSEMYMRGGRDTVIVVWSALAFMLCSFLALSAIVGDPPAPPPAPTIFYP
ncbi:MAG: hypothetical protein QM756_01980 [Polyangiaceae bacterium]